MRIHLTILTITVLATGSLFAAVKPHPLFTDGAVLQRGQVVPVWGTAKEGEKVTVEMAGQKLTTTAKDGTWRVDFKPLTAGGPYQMTISGENTVTINNLLVGEVWVCSGQSNMEFILSRTGTLEREAPKATFPEIRMFTVRRNTNANPQTEPAGAWRECSPKTVGDFSAVGYFFARDIYQKLGVPVGMIHTSWGGTPAQSWTSIEGLAGNPEMKEYLDEANKNLDPAFIAAYQAEFEAYKAAKKSWDRGDGAKWQRALKSWKTKADRAKKSGKPIPPKPKPASAAPQPPVEPGKAPRNSCTLFNGMVAPIIPYGIKGVIWYQGESNAENVEDALQYRSLFPTMIADWRSKWNQGTFPFLYVQIAPFKKQPPEIRESQFVSLAKTENTAMAVTTDVGNAEDIHPRNKQPVGQRLALAARALAYGEKIEYSGPLYQSMAVEGNKARIRFTHAGRGLVAKDGALKGFTIAGANGKFVPANAEIQGEELIVSAADVAAPKAVRYGWANVPDVNLYNMEGLPASPFRTDVD